MATCRSCNGTGIYNAHRQDKQADVGDDIAYTLDGGESTERRKSWDRRISDKVMRRAMRVMRDEITQMEKKAKDVEELHANQLSAITTTLYTNTRTLLESVKKQFCGNAHPYFTATLGDAIKAMEREIGHRERSERLAAQIVTSPSDKEMMIKRIECLEDDQKRILTDMNNLMADCRAHFNSRVAHGR